MCAYSLQSILMVAKEISKSNNLFSTLFFFGERKKGKITKLPFGQGKEERERETQEL